MINTIEYVKLDEVDEREFIALLNKEKIREHLIQHDVFGAENLNTWIANKKEVDSLPGCKVRAILVDQHLAGWCGIQLEEGNYEIAVVIDENYWGLGTRIFRDVLGWAQELGHKFVLIHLLHTRPEYKFLRKMATKVHESELLGSQFTTYELDVKAVSLIFERKKAGVAMKEEVMTFSLFHSSDTEEVIELFTDVFAASEGETEGQIIGELVSELIATTDSQDLIGCVAQSDDYLVGCIFFSRFIVPDGQDAFILSPVAIASGAQGKGIGQRLIHYGLNHLKSLDVNLVFTYGDPAFYGKTGFEQIGEDVVKAPFKLSQPQGWLAQSLNGYSIRTMDGPTQCVKALSDQKYW